MANPTYENIHRACSLVSPPGCLLALGVDPPFFTSDNLADSAALQNCGSYVDIGVQINLWNTLIPIQDHVSVVGLLSVTPSGW